MLYNNPILKPTFAPISIDVKAINLMDVYWIDKSVDDTTLLFQCNIGSKPGGFEWRYADKTARDQEYDSLVGTTAEYGAANYAKPFIVPSETVINDAGLVITPAAINIHKIQGIDRIDNIIHVLFDATDPKDIQRWGFSNSASADTVEGQLTDVIADMDPLGAGVTVSTLYSSNGTLADSSRFINMNGGTIVYSKSTEDATTQFLRIEGNDEGLMTMRNATSGLITMSVGNDSSVAGSSTINQMYSHNGTSNNLSEVVTRFPDVTVDYNYPEIEFNLRNQAFVLQGQPLKLNVDSSLGTGTVKFSNELTPNEAHGINVISAPDGGMSHSDIGATYTQQLQRASGVIALTSDIPTVPTALVNNFTDYPTSYSGEALKVARVNAGETGLEFVTLTTDNLGNANLVQTAAQDRTYDINTQFLKFVNGNVGFGTAAAPDASAIVEMQSTTQGFLPPRMTTANKNAIATPATGLEVFDTDLNEPQYYDGSSWTGAKNIGNSDFTFPTGTALRSLISNATDNIQLKVESIAKNAAFEMRVRSAAQLGLVIFNNDDDGNQFLIQDTGNTYSFPNQRNKFLIAGGNQRDAVWIAHNKASSTGEIVLACAAETGDPEFQDSKKDLSIKNGQVSVCNDSSFGIGSGTFSNNPSAIFQVNSSSKGAVLPRMDTSNRDGIASPIEGLLVYNLDTQRIDWYDGTAWIGQQPAITASLTDLSGDITPTTPDYVLTATNGGWGCGSQDEFETMTSVIKNLQDQVNELKTVLQSQNITA